MWNGASDSDLVRVARGFSMVYTEKGYAHVQIMRTYDHVSVFPAGGVNLFRFIFSLNFAAECSRDGAYLPFLRYLHFQSVPCIRDLVGFGTGEIWIQQFNTYHRGCPRYMKHAQYIIIHHHT